MSKKKRILSVEEKHLWERVKQTAIPLSQSAKLLNTQLEKADSAQNKKPIKLSGAAANAPFSGGAASVPFTSGEARTVGKNTPRQVLRPIGKSISEPNLTGSIFTPVETSTANQLERTTTRKIANGRISIDRKIDLHGLTQNEAYHRLQFVIEEAWFAEKRTVLVVTGKGKGEGILRQAVPRWLSEAGFRMFVSGVSEAHLSHGGGGALYVRLKRRRAR